MSNRKKIVVKLGVVISLFAIFFAAACGDATSVTATDTPEDQDKKQELLDELVFDYFDPEATPFRAEIEDCFDKINYNLLVAGVNGDFVFDKTTPIDAQKEKDNLKVTENTFNQLSKCREFGRINLGRYDFYTESITNTECEKSIYWQKYHAVRAAKVTVSVDEALRFGGDVLRCTNFINQNFEANQAIYSWFDWSCLESLNILRPYSEEAIARFARSLFENTSSFSQSEFAIAPISSEIISNFIFCTDYNNLRDILRNQGSFRDEGSFRTCLRARANEESFRLRLNEDREQGVRIYPNHLSNIIPSCFFISSSGS